MLSRRRARHRGVDASRWRGRVRSLLGGLRIPLWVRGGLVLGKLVGLGCSGKLSWCTGETP